MEQKFNISKLQADDNKICVAALDLYGVLRTKYISRRKFLSLVEHDKGFGFCDVIFKWDLDNTSSIVDGQVSPFSDAMAYIDYDSYRRVETETGSIPFFFLKFLDHQNLTQIDHRDPRGLLYKVLKEFINDLNLLPIAGLELEMMVAQMSSTDPAGISPISSRSNGYSFIDSKSNLSPLFDELYNASLKAEIPMECYHVESGPAVIEAAIEHCNAIELADRSSLFKSIAKLIGRKHNLKVSFMAATYNDIAGSSGHIHISLSNLMQNNDNVFYDSESKPYFISDVAKQFMAGLLRYLPDLMPMLAPTINSYKRFGRPYTSTSFTWGVEDRRAAIRFIIPPRVASKDVNLELRIPGADLCAHHALAAVLASGKLGISQKLELTVPELEIGEKSGYKYTPIPTSLSEATELMRKSSAARQMFGDDFVNFICASKDLEIDLYNKHVSDWEVRRYIDLV